MDPRDLKSAATYVNNLLAARGLLRGLPIDFARPARDDGTPARIINLVHELVQRRDRDAEQRENLALTIRTLRNSDSKNLSTIEALKAKNAELERKVALLEGQTRTFNSTLRTAEASTKSFRDEATRQKTLLSQVRTQCANEIRKRDIQIQKMKERLQDTRRGTRQPISQITVTGGTPSLSGSTSSSQDADPVSLAQDTADFLSTLSQNLSDENDNLIALLRQCISTLKALQGLPDDMHIPQTEEEAEDAVNPVSAPPASHEALSLELESTMYSLREMVNQPNYVPVEELEERDAEIARLTQRNETLQEEWKKAIDLVDGWNKSLAKGASPLKPTQENRPLTELLNGERITASGKTAAPPERGVGVEKDTANRTESDVEDNELQDRAMAMEVENTELSTRLEGEKRRKSLRTKPKHAKSRDREHSPDAIHKKKRRSSRRRGSVALAPDAEELDTIIVNG